VTTLPADTSVGAPADTSEDTSEDTSAEAHVGTALDRLLADVLSRTTTDSRLAEVAGAFVAHLHAAVREVRPTAQEWQRGLEFLVRVGQACTPERDEMVLLSDMLGLTAAVDEVDHAGPAGATPSSVEGPFHSPAPPRERGDWIAAGPERHRAPVTVVHGRVLDVHGNAVPGATVDVWQADDDGRYDTQDAAQPAGNLRGLFTADVDGAWWFRSVLPSSYPVPTVGPVGELLLALGRHPMRPAHLHLRVEAVGHRPVTTHVFVAGDPYLDSDAAFGVKDDLVVTPVSVDDPARSAAAGVDGPFLDIAFDVRLAVAA
jgi:hydroxyquinol 1,2-dioxygenase